MGRSQVLGTSRGEGRGEKDQWKGGSIRVCLVWVFEGFRFAFFRSSFALTQEFFRDNFVFF